MRKLFFYSTLLFLVAVASCKKDDDISECPCDDPSNPECENYDPCFGNEEPNARFFTEARLTWPEFGENLWIHDTILKGGLIRFRSPFEGDGISHKWYIGAEIIEEASVTRNFNQVQRPATLTVSHVINYPIDTICYPQAIGIDSTSQTFSLIDAYSELLTVDNVFRGVLNNNPDSFDFKFRLLQFSTGIPSQWDTHSTTGYLINFHNNQDSVRNDGWSITNTHFTLTDGSIPKGMLIIDPSDLSVEMNYNFPDNETDYTFRGRVIPE